MQTDAKGKKELSSASWTEYDYRQVVSKHRHYSGVSSDWRTMIPVYHSIDMYVTEIWVWIDSSWQQWLKSIIIKKGNNKQTEIESI